MRNIHDFEVKNMLRMANDARDRAYVPYSGFRVGAAIRCPDGSVHAGCNVENVAYPEGTCAEAGAIAAMVAAGETRLTEVFVIADCPVPVSPCGGCRQKLREFSVPEELIIIAGDPGGIRQRWTLAELLPHSFGPSHLNI